MELHGAPQSYTEKSGRKNGGAPSQIYDFLPKDSGSHCFIR
jgi:hypothetical protein